MFSYILRRLLYIIPLLVGITFVTFTVMHLAPGKPLDQGPPDAGPDADDGGLLVADQFVRKKKGSGLVFGAKVSVTADEPFGNES